MKGFRSLRSLTNSASAAAFTFSYGPRGLKTFAASSLPHPSVHANTTPKFPSPILWPGLHAVVQELRRCALVALETDLDALGGERLAIVEREPFPQLELVHQPVRALRPRLARSRAADAFRR